MANNAGLAVARKPDAKRSGSRSPGV